MVHLRIVVPPDTTDAAMDALCGTDSVRNVILLQGASRRPDGDVILCDVAREDASVVLEDLKGLNIHERGSIALEAKAIDTEISRFADRAGKHASANHGLANIIASPDFLAFFVAICAGAAGMLSLSTSKSGALIGVLISVTTIPAAANIGIAAAYGDREGWVGSVEQLAVNMAAILLSGTATLAVQRALYQRRRAQALAQGEARREARAALRAR